MATFSTELRARRFRARRFAAIHVFVWSKICSFKKVTFEPEQIRSRGGNWLRFRYRVMEKWTQRQRVRSAVRWFGLLRGADPRSTSLTDWATAAGGATADFSPTTHSLANGSESPLHFTS